MKKTTGVLKKFLLFILSLSITQSYAQLSGTYTINAVAAASSTNYTSFSAAVFDLTSATGIRPDGGPRNGPGVSTAVVFNIANGTYNEHVLLNAVAGTSFTKTVTFRGQDSLKAVLSDDTAYTFRLNSAKFIQFRNMAIVNSNLYYGTALQLENRSDYMEISNCYIEASYPTMGGSNAAISISASSGSTISNCFIKGGVTGIKLTGSEDGQTINDNFFTGNGFSIDAEYQTDVQILRNTITNTVHQGGIHIYAGTNFKIDRNIIICNKIGIKNGGLTGSSITNNFIRGSNAIRSDNVGGWIHGTQILHNTFIGADNFDGVFRINGIQNSKIENNIFYAKGGGCVFYLGGIDSNTVFDYNVYYVDTLAGGIMARNPFSIYKSLYNLQNAPPALHHKHIITTKPAFVSDTDLHLSTFAGAAIGDTTINVPYDIDGQPRCLPYIGADALPGGGGMPVAAFSAPDTVQLNDTLFFYADTIGSGGPNQYSWDINNDNSTEIYGLNAGWIFTVPGTYQVKLTAENCTGKHQVVKTIVVKDTTANPPLGIGSVIPELYFNIFPNPVNAAFTVKLSRELQGGEISILSVTGQEMKRIPALSGNEFRIESEDLSAGVYFILIKENGSVTGSRKLIIE